MTQIVARIGDDLARAIDELVEEGLVESRSAAVRQGLEQFVDRIRRDLIGDTIVAGYERTPQTEAELLWREADTDRMVLEEPW